MAVTPQEVHKVALLARLAISAQEEEKITSQLNRILEYVEQLSELDTEGVEPFLSPAFEENRFREDESRPGLSPEAALQNAPRKVNQFFQVPRIIE